MSLYARQQINNTRRQNNMKPHGILSNWKPVTIAELKKYCAIIIHMGLVEKPELSEYWSADPAVHTSFAGSVMVGYKCYVTFQ